MAIKTFTILSAATLAVVVVSAEPGHAGGAFSGSCVRSGSAVACSAQWGKAQGGIPHVLQMPALTTDRAEAESAERDRKWVARCKPIVQQDRYGVGRYHYLATGCEYGKTED
jgi:hypothetical protein